MGHRRDGSVDSLSPAPPERASIARRGMRPETESAARAALSPASESLGSDDARTCAAGAFAARELAETGRATCAAAVASGAAATLVALARLPASRRDRTSTGVAPSDTASRRRDWSLDETFECAALAAHTLAALADADPDGRYDLVAVPHALDALLSLLETSRETAADGETRARRHRERDRDCSSSRRRACAAAAAAALFRLAPEPATAAALACRPDAIAALARLARDDEIARDDETSDETACSALGVLWVTTRGAGGTSWAPSYVAPGGGSGSGASTPRGGGSVGGWTSTRFHGPVSTARDAPALIAAHIAHEHLHDLAAAMRAGAKDRRGDEDGKDEVSDALRGRSARRRRAAWIAANVARSSPTGAAAVARCAPLLASLMASAGRRRPMNERAAAMSAVWYAAASPGDAASSPAANRRRILDAPGCAATLVEAVDGAWRW